MPKKKQMKVRKELTCAKNMRPTRRMKMPRNVHKKTLEQKVNSKIRAASDHLTGPPMRTECLIHLAVLSNRKATRKAKRNAELAILDIAKYADQCHQRGD